MTTAQVKIKQWGNSLGVVIPSDIVKREQLRPGDTIKVDLMRHKKADGFGLFKGPAFQEEDEHPNLW